MDRPLVDLHGFDEPPVKAGELVTIHRPGWPDRLYLVMETRPTGERDWTLSLLLDPEDDNEGKPWS